MKRRHFIENGIKSLGALSLSSCSSYLINHSPGYLSDDGFTYLLPRSTDAAILAVPSEMRVPFNWNSFGLNKELVKINFAKPRGQKALPALFRISTAIDVREQKQVEVSLPLSRRILGVLDIKYSPVFQPFQLALTISDVQDVFKEGIALKQIKGNSPLWLFDAGNEDVANKGLMPHLLFHNRTKRPLDVFYTNLLSLNVVQTFGWMEGCVLDGLLDISKRYPEKKVTPVISSHLQLFFDKQNNLIYEGPFSKPYVNKFYGIESLLPFGAIAQLNPEHPLLPVVAAYCTSKANSNGLIQDNHVTTEGCYTIAYPLVSIAVALKEKKLALLAIQQLLLRKSLLVKDNNIHQRMDENKQLSFPNWARGVCWYLLGMVRTLAILDDNKDIAVDFENEISLLKKEFIRAAGWARHLQDSSGLWFCFLDKPATGIDTSGSAGIAAAMAMGTARNYLPATFKLSSKRTLDGLLKYVTPDGFLSGVAQANKGGIALQENGYRVISQYASGLMAQLIAAVT